MTQQERIAAIQELGYSERESTFLCLAALHGGYFLRRQYNRFLEQSAGGNADRLIRKAVAHGHIRVHGSAAQTMIYHLGTKPFFTLIGEEDNRNRRWRQPYSVKIKLIGFDFVLAHAGNRYLATELEKLEFFAGAYRLDRAYLPARTYRSRDGRRSITRYFVDKFPVFISSGTFSCTPGVPSAVVGFCYVDGSVGKPCGFDTHLIQYRALFGKLKRFQLVYVATDERMFPKAERIFGRLCGDLGWGTGNQEKTGEQEPLLDHFRRRAVFEKRQTAAWSKSALDQYRREAEEFAGPENEALYRQWLSEGDGAFEGKKREVAVPEVQFSVYRVREDYGFLGPLARA